MPVAPQTPQSLSAFKSLGTGLTFGKGPAIAMEPADHQRTESYQSSRAAIRYRRMQRELIQQGRFREAVQMDIDDIRSKFGSKYEAAIDQMLRYVNQISPK